MDLPKPDFKPVAFPKMTYEYWCEHSKELLAEAEKYNGWRERAKHRLLTVWAPRIGRLGKRFYLGCGFHYAMDKDLGRLLIELAMPVQWSANWCENIPEQRLRMICDEVCVKDLKRRVRAAERSAESWTRKRNKKG